MQSLHYLTISLFVVPLLNFFAEPSSLAYEGGAASVGGYLVSAEPNRKTNGTLFLGMVMDWREMAGKPTIRGLNGTSYGYVWSDGRKIAYGWKDDQWSGRTDPLRAWIIAVCWLLACGAESVRVYSPPDN